jgi:DNA replication and repair protein RecF
MLGLGRGFRTRFDKELIGFEFSGAEILADIFSQEREHTIRILLDRNRKKTITRNSVKTAPGELSRTLTTVLFCPDDLYIIKSGAHERRKLLDTCICQLRPGYTRLLSEYNRLLEHKQSILKNQAENPALLQTLDDFSGAMCRTAAKIIRYRASFTERLSGIAEKIAADFSGSNERLNIKYKTVSTVTDPLADAHIIIDRLYEHQEAHRQAELASASCLCGPHRDELLITIGGESARDFASQGQTRTAALSIKLAEREIFLAETGEYPVLLLDDVLSELDRERQEFVLNRIGGGQTLITCCEDENIAKRTGGKVLTVSKGNLS